jgi:hypothetical protein
MSIYADQDNGGRPTVDKDPNAVLDYQWDLSAWLARDGNSVASYTLNAVGVTVDSHGESAGVITAWVSGGQVGSPASVTCRVTTSSTPPRVDDRTLWFNIMEQ